MLALEVAGSVAEVEKRAGDKGDLRRDRHLRLLEIDAYFVPAYWAILSALGILLGFRPREWSWQAWPLWAGVAAVLSASVAALADTSENARLRTVLERPLAVTTDDLVRGCEPFSCSSGARAL